MQSSTDFLRQLPDSAAHFARGEGFWRRLHIDPIMLLLLLMLTFFGLLVLYSGSGQSTGMVKRQVAFYIIAYGAMFTVAQIDMKILARWAPWFYGIGIILLILVYVIGVQAKGAQRWISLGFIRFQPSEALKIAVPVAVAAYFSSRMLPPKFKHVLASLMIIALPAVLILKQPDLGTSILISASGLIVLFLAGLRWRYIFGSALLLAASAWPIWNFVLQGYQKRRILTLFNPEADRFGDGWNTIQAKISIGSGGMEGKGWLNGSQSQLDFLPESHTDFIIAVLAEEFGFVGVLALLGLYLAIIMRGLFIAWNAKNSFNRLLAGSLILTFFVYVFVNIAMVSGLLPVVGVPLPLVSLGGTSLVTLMLAFGILMAIATDSSKT
ncbi:rod shape-determining protein RodA [Agaribacterium haliotis]|uniref:rod shape-determining protein RodA n=1 Tax=Agaribacterium haliotis TaxID=2013869 RepID=UPI000BB54501|nr:rod shape-determining protein RodA [Agaribacterium haliotis]